MTLPFFTIQGTDECCWEGCEAPGEVLGFCQRHYQEACALRHAALRRANLAAPKPDCFDSDDEWLQYEVWWNMSIGAGGLRPAEPCTDCDPQTQQRMMACGRCEHPETVFVIRSGEMVGLNMDMHGWKRAAMGRGLPVVAAPDKEVLLQHLSIYEGRKSEGGKGTKD